MTEEHRPHSAKHSRRRASTFELNESPISQQKQSEDRKRAFSAKKAKSRRRSRSELNILKQDTEQHDENVLHNAAYKKDDIVLSKDTGSTMCVIKTIRSSNGLQYGIVIPPESNIRYIKPGKIIKKLCPESVIARIDTITKAYEDANGEMLKLQQQIKMARKQCDIEKDKFKKLKQRFMDQNHQNTDSAKMIDKLQRENEKLRRELEQKHTDLHKIEKDKADGNPLQKQLKEANKQIKALNKIISEQRITLNKQKTELSQQKANINRSKLDDKSDSKKITKLTKDGLIKDRTISDLKQQMIALQNKLIRANYDINRSKDKDKMMVDYSMEQMGVQNIRLENRLKALKNKENEFERMEETHKLNQKDWSLHKKQSSLQNQQDIDAAEKIYNRRKKQQLEDIAKQKEDVLRLRQLLEMTNRYKSKKNKGYRKDEDKTTKQKRYERKRHNRTKIIVHKKYLCKEYMDCCIKWRKRKDAITKTSNGLKALQESLKPSMKRLNKLDENKRISKGKNKLEKVNKNDLKEFLDVAIPLEDIEDELGDILLDLHPEGKAIKNLPLQLLTKQEEIDRLNTEMDALQNELEKYRLNNKIQKKLNAISIAMDDDDIDAYDDGGDAYDVDDDEVKENKMPNPYKLQFAGMYRMVANLNENKEQLLRELRSLICKIGDDIHKDKKNNSDDMLISQLATNYKDNVKEFAPKTEALCMEYTVLQQQLSEGDTRTRRKKRYSDSENSYKGTDRIFMQKHSRDYDDDDSSSVMSDSDDIWSGTQRMSINQPKYKRKGKKMSGNDLHKTTQKVDDLTENTRQHLSELKQKQDEYKLIKQRMNGTKRDLVQCQGLLEVIEDKETECHDDEEDIACVREDLRVYNDIVEGANSNLENVVSSLEQDDERLSRLMNELQDLKSKLSDKKLKKLQQELVRQQTSMSEIPAPNVLELQDLRRKIGALYQCALDDADWLENSIKCIEKYKKKTMRLQDKVEELSPSIHRFARRPQRKLLEFMMEYNWDLGEIADRLKDREQSLTKFADKNQDIRMEEGIEVGNEFREQHTILDEYKKTIHILEEKHKGIMFDKMDDTVTQHGPVYELEGIMDEIADLLSNTTQKINDNNLNLRTQRFGCFLRLEQINNIRDLLIDTVQIPIPSKANIEDLHEDEDEDDEDNHNDKGLQVELNEMRMKCRLVYNNEYVQELAGCTMYDDTMRLCCALNRIRATLGSISALHYAVISDTYLKPKVMKTKDELNKLQRNYQSFEPISTDISIDDEVSNYEIQFVQDLAADYHRINESDDKRFVIKENIKIITDKVCELNELCDLDVKCIELKHLKDVYESFYDEKLPQPLSLYDIGIKERIKSTKKSDYKTLIAQKYVGLNDDNDEENVNHLRELIEQIETELFRCRSGVMPSAFNLIYQDGVLFGDAFPGDFRKLKKYKQSQKDMDDMDELVFNVEDYDELSKKDQIELIKELMSLEWKYTEWINDREDYVTQTKLYRSEALYYKRLFVLPLDDFYLEKERKNIFCCDYYHDEVKIKDDDDVGLTFVEERQMIEVEHKAASSEYEEERRVIEVEHKPIHYKQYGLKPFVRNKQKQSGFAQEYDSEDYESTSSDINYLSLDSEHAQHKGKHMKQQQNGDSRILNDKMDARGIGIELEIGDNRLCNLEMDDINHDIHCSPHPAHNIHNNNNNNNNNLEIDDDIGHDIHCSPNPMLFKQNAMRLMNEMEVMNMNTTKTQETEESKELELERVRIMNANVNHEGSSTEYDETDTEHGEDEDEDDEEYVLDKLREILGNHQFLPCLDDEDEVDLMLDQIESLCKDVDKYHNKYINHSQKNKKLRNELECAETTLDDLAHEHDRLKQEYLKLREENDELLSKLRKHKRYENNRTWPTSTAGGPNDGGYDEDDDGMEERDILHQLKDDLLHLRQNINDSKQSAKAEYKESKIRLESMCEPLRDLANDFDSDPLKDALSKLSKSLNDIGNLEKQRLYQHGPLANIVESNIDDIDDLLNLLHQTPTKGAPISGKVDEMDKLYPELIYLEEDQDEDDDDKTNDNDAEPGRATPGQSIEFDANFPVVRRIEIDGHWFNKKPRAVIEWNGNTFRRKMTDFKWLWRMLLLNSSIDRVVPDYPNDIPESLWPEGYLRRRKRELNLFLMQCHSLPWIKKYNLYFDIFLEKDKKEWKQKRNDFDEYIMQRIKNKESTYYPLHDSDNANDFDDDNNRIQS